MFLQQSTHEHRSRIEGITILIVRLSYLNIRLGCLSLSYNFIFDTIKGKFTKIRIKVIWHRTFMPEKILCWLSGEWYISLVSKSWTFFKVLSRQCNTRNIVQWISWCVNFFQKRQAIASLKEIFYLMGQKVLAVE